MSMAVCHCCNSGGDRYPVDEWRFLGMLHASNEREVQTFLLSPDESSYAKFLRVDMVSHYGSEHFCPLSLLRVNGSSMMEVSALHRDVIFNDVIVM